MAEVHCARCGAAGDPIALGWMSEHDPRRGRVWICQACSREHLRAIEAKLAQEWW